MEFDATEMSLEEQLSIYDDDFPRELPTWDADALVTPRAFLSEYGYDLDGYRLPTTLGAYLMEEIDPSPILTLVRTFGTDSWEGKDPEDIKSMVEKGGYNMVKLYRFDGTLPKGNMLEAYSQGGFLIEYSYTRREDKLKETGHDRLGYYWLDINGTSELIKKLLYGLDEGPWADDTEGQTPREWEKKENPAGRQKWAVAMLQNDQLRVVPTEFASQYLLDEGLRQSAANSGVPIKD
ncbi:hypothetical protein HLRTI_002897 [Halorhabdus tiamatea SARL4B]|uniref:Uncharacterized protein n=1 Tax=Halorhabdus tiamatea SARL4B TaxID=1033806 RepID=U2DY47_9EURY|nr:hypothetical protein [Halorhabdus tiamatea]ERJ05098.1 hypothetical protein HLRTI_002897 [Halorhabdus tiamatea SARL4B]